MMTKKTMTILSVFMIVALTAVGFAAWLIVGTIEGETQGSFVSNELKDKYFKVEVDFDTTTDKENGQIIFGRPTTDYVYSNGSWLSYSNRDAKQKLSATATVKFIPDDGFLVDDDVNTENRDMKYYLEKIVDEDLDDPENDVKKYRTVRVVIDINEVISEATKNYKWFDMAVELGYIQYPTAKWVAHTGAAKADTDLKWGKIENEGGEDVVKALEVSELADKNFENNFLYIDLTHDMFKIADDNKYATANIQIDFAWGEAVATGEGEERVYNNPYTYFDELNPEDPAIVLQYLDVATEELKATEANEQDATKPGVENYHLDNAQTIRYKGLAQRMLDYLRDYLNYVPADTEADPAVEESGIQFSIVLSEGTPVVVE